MDGDTALARHITYVHKHNRNPELGFTPYDPEFIKNYVAAAVRTAHPSALSHVTCFFSLTPPPLSLSLFIRART